MIVLSFLCLFVLLFIMADGRLVIPCLFKAATSIPCPGCGGMRSASLLLRGDIPGALAVNPLSVAVILFIAVSAGWLSIDIVRGRDTYWRIFRTQWSRRAIVLAIAAVAANWVWNILKGL